METEVIILSNIIGSLNNRNCNFYSTELSKGFTIMDSILFNLSITMPGTTVRIMANPLNKNVERTIATYRTELDILVYYSLSNMIGDKIENNVLLIFKPFISEYRLFDAAKLRYNIMFVDAHKKKREVDYAYVSDNVITSYNNILKNASVVPMISLTDEAFEIVQEYANKLPLLDVDNIIDSVLLPKIAIRPYYLNDILWASCKTGIDYMKEVWSKIEGKLFGQS